MGYPTPLLGAKLAQLKAQNEATRQALLATALFWLEHHAAEFGIRAGYVFGAITQAGCFSARSDVDLAIENLRQGNPFGLAGSLSSHLNREVDLAPLEQPHFVDKIRQTGIV